MKNSFTKLLVSCAAVMSVAAIMAVSASAADAVSYDKASKTITNGAAAPEGVSGQITILVQKETESALTEGDIIYINQDAYTDGVPAAWQSIKTADELANGNYYLKMGGEGVTNVTSELFVVADEVVDDEYEEYLLGNVNRDAVVNYKDATMMLQHATKKNILEGDDFTLADITKDNTVNYKDATAALKHATKKEIITETVKVKKVAAE